MWVSRPGGAVVSAAMSLLLAASLAGAAQATGPTKGADVTGEASTRAAQKVWEVEDCSDDSYIFDAKSITVEPDPPGAEDTVITLHGKLKEELLYGAASHVTLKLGLVTLMRKTFDIAEELRRHDAPVQAPIAPGEVSLPIAYIPSLSKEGWPKADFRIYVESVNYDDKDLACVKVHGDLRRRL